MPTDDNVHGKSISLDAEDAGLRIESWRPGDDVVSSVALVLPGANCVAARYRWVASALSASGMEACIVDPPLSQRSSLLEPEVRVTGQFVNATQLQAAMRWLKRHRKGLPIVVLGHSLGGVVLLEWLDRREAKRNPGNGAVQWEFDALQEPLIAAIVMGSTLQPRTMGVTIPWRREDTPLARPRELPVLMLAGERDGLIPPAAVEATALRYDPPVRFETLPGVCHFGWTSGSAPTDRVDLDGASPAPPSVQQQRTLDVIDAFLKPLLETAACSAAGRRDGQA